VTENLPGTSLHRPFCRLPLSVHSCFTRPVPQSFFTPPPLESSYDVWGPASYAPQRKKSTASRKSWRGPCAMHCILCPHDLRSWRGHVPRVPLGGCAHDYNTAGPGKPGKPGKGFLCPSRRVRTKNGHDCECRIGQIKTQSCLD